MYNAKFFEKPINYVNDNFQKNLSAAINIIKQNQSVLAKKILDAINSKKIIIHSFFNVTEEHFFKIRNDIKKEYGEVLPENFPPDMSTIREIESKLEGIIYDDKVIYISSKKNPQNMANTLVHEICHFLNAGMYIKEKKINPTNLVGYCDEVRAHTGEKIFERNGKCLRRSDIKQIHKQVTELYPEFLVSYEDALELGYIYSSYDGPTDRILQPLSL
ncbi:hypothetical protein Lsan_4144 [Legionella santicrucis]|uniref:IrrE N-terminal-like domain-containing protein n=1 Tax=Legionella santicrucis TaxID=45074 RepID=A0A0W0YAT5_9GAMM|nr:hypothetical protein [Legionella santicrucis]KTD53734.1 hypothetical protein Lsan_4144 [Legionella santicrucis]